MAALAPFDHKREFEVRRRDFLYAGTAYKVGDAFDKTDIPPRKLEMLFHGRFIGYRDASPKTKAPVFASPVDPVAIDAPVVPDEPPAPRGPTRDERFEALMAAHTKASLIALAAEAGMKPDRASPKAVIAAALVEADADGAA